MPVSLPSATELTTKRALAGRFSRQPATVVLATTLLAAAVARTAVGDWSWVDLALVVTIAALIGPTEWLIHRMFFHAGQDSLRSRRLRTGHRHRLHHDQPSDLEWLLLDVRGVIVLMAATGALVLVLAGVVVLATAASGLALFGTGLIVAWAALVNYEWTHLLIHSRYRPRSRRYRRLARHHLAHHHRDEGRWLGVTTNLGDRVFGTTSG